MTKPIIVAYRQGSASGSTPCKPDELANLVKKMLKQYRKKPGGVGTDYDHFSITIGTNAFVLREKK